MRHLKPLLFLTFAAVCSATPVLYNNVSVHCVQNPGATPSTFESLTVTVDPAVNGGTITAGAIATNNCLFNLAGNALSAPFTNGTYNYTSTLDKVCYAVGGFCFTGSGPVSLEISAAAGGKFFRIVASSVETTFTLPTTPGGGGGTPPPPVPEPSSLILLGSGLTIFGLTSAKRLRRS